MKLTTHGWSFEFDKQATQRNYESVVLCECADCRNFYANADKMPRDLRKFLEQFGIDITRPIETWSTEADKENMLVNNNEIFYAVNGYAVSTIEPCEPIAIGGTAIYPDSVSPNVFTPPTTSQNLILYSMSLTYGCRGLLRIVLTSAIPNREKSIRISLIL